MIGAARKTRAIHGDPDVGRCGAAGGRIVSYRWSFGDGSAEDTAPHVQHAFGASGSYAVELRVTDEDGATGRADSVVRVLALPNAPPQPAFGVVCAHYTCTFSDSSTDADSRIVQWHWSFGDGTEGDGPSPVHTYAAADAYRVGLTVSDEGGLTSSTGRLVTVPVAVAGEPALAFSDSAIGFCYSPGSIRNCVRLEEHVLFTSTRERLAWRTTTSEPWIVVQPTSGTTDTDVRVFVDFDRLPPGSGGHGSSISGSVTVSATGAGNSPAIIPVRLQFYSSPPPR